MYAIHMFLRRHPSLTPAAFRSHYETTHVPLLKSILGPHFALRHTRRYVARAEAAPHDAQAFPLPGTDAAATARFFDNFDVAVEIMFEDEAAFGEMARVAGLEENRKRIRADEETFLDVEAIRVVVIGEVCETRRED